MLRATRRNYQIPIRLICLYLAFIPIRGGALNSPVPNLPEQIHISWGEDPRSMVRVVWQTRNRTATEIVEYGTSQRLGLRATGKNVTYPQQTGALHEATLSRLKAGTAYYYRVGDQTGGLSKTYSFRTAPAKPEDFVFTAFGDQGIQPASRKNVVNALSEKPAFHLLLGDLAYANGKQEIWDQYFRMIEPLASTVPFMPTMGNHENEANPEAGGHRELGTSAYLARLALPGAETYYSFDYSGVRFVNFNTERYNDKSQLAWLDQTLASARRDPAIRWLIVYHHVPLYSSVKKRPDRPEIIQRLQPLYDKYHVDLVLTGHNHVYERFYPLRGGKPVDTNPSQYQHGAGTVYVTCGGGGDSLYKFKSEQPARDARRERTFCYLRVSVPMRGPLVVEAKRLDGSLIERFQILPR